MRALSYSAYGDPGSLSLTELPTPKVAPGAVLIQVHRAAVNPVDWKLMAGGLDGMIDVVFPVVPGWDVTGTVAALGPDVPEFQVGQRVAAYARKDVVSGGTYAEYVAVPATSVAAVPEGVSDEAAAGLPLAGLTALRSLEALDPLGPGDTVLIHAASGGVGHLAAQLAVAAGATVLGTASEANHERLRALGVTPLSYGEGLPDRVREHAPDGVTAVADFVGGVLDDTLAVLRPGGRHVSIADPGVAEAGGRWIWVRPDGARLATLLRLVAEGSLRVEIDRVFPLAEGAEALALSRDGQARGKLIIDVTR
ncbi:NADP-dependent oxidoreductase [Sediminivirga luteola]|uniref:Oxidoreductase n=1 Tax=Sediminivirga luteola TaxID=1774748 RepID=A0A8J2XLI3_9MICO|nr:NADP-dependent oxidoreductase [Sediminivirga luteola]MCI2264087.1 NADP-dependent oxidoreductase [Sediminivirga luteola]GGA22472.1 oxidoreductase [Sediminivirga luteola]